MDVQGSTAQRSQWTGDGLVVGMFENSPELTDGFADLPVDVKTALQDIIADTAFQGKAGSCAIARVGGSSLIRKVGVVGLGKKDSFSVESLRQAAGAIAQAAHKQKCQTVAVDLPIHNDDASLSAQVITEGLVLALHTDLRFKSDEDFKSKNRPTLNSVDLLGFADETAAIARGQQICEGVILARELVSAPANVVTPITLAETVTAIAHDYGLELEILEKADCETLGMGSFLGVAQASELPPKFIHLTYKPVGTPRRKLAIVGKGLTFDSGGLNLKVAGSGIELMKIDMGGAAATFGAAKAIAQIQPDVEVHFISAATENMISGRAMHPGDILTASNGKTIEVNNTDAEGRLTLADALVFADKLGVDAIVDLATLTGACVVALGDHIAGLWTAEDDLANTLLDASDKAGESFWRMPIEESYFDGMKSVVADMKNTGPRAGGSITATLFLKQFVQNTPWAHLDIAGPVWTDKDKGYNKRGATGFAVRTLVNWILA